MPPVLPHRRYLQFLASRKEPFAFAAQQNRQRGYGALDRAAWFDVVAGLGQFPASWRHVLQPENVDLFRWLRKIEVLPLWQNQTHKVFQLTPVATRVLNLTLTLNLNDATGAQALLQMEAIVPQMRGVLTAQDVLLYRDLFWDLRPYDIFAEDVQEVLVLRRPELERVFAGDPVGAFACVNYFPVADKQAALNAVIGFGLQQTALASRLGLISDGRQGAAVAAAQATLMRALEMRDQGGDRQGRDLKSEAAAFVLAQPTSAPAIAHVDEVQASSAPRTQEPVDDLSQIEFQRLRTLSAQVDLVSPSGKRERVLEDP